MGYTGWVLRDRHTYTPACRYTSCAYAPAYRYAYLPHTYPPAKKKNSLLRQAAVPTEVNVMISMAYLAFIAADELGLSGLMAGRTLCIAVLSFVEKLMYNTFYRKRTHSIVREHIL